MSSLKSPEEKSPAEVVEHVQEAFRRYYDTQYWVKSLEIRKERENLLLQHKALYSEPLVELVHPYPASEDCIKVCESMGLSEGFAKNLVQIVFGDNTVKRQSKREKNIRITQNMPPLKNRYSGAWAARGQNIAKSILNYI